ncbi:MAG TPA: hypothetical protein VG815_19035 [Chloroflexota bacterium]|jgi:hypothetical protein|nr:hypothetical protein [Chloroflexota bacterium]
MTSTPTPDPYAVEPATLMPNSDEPDPRFGGEVSAESPRQDMFVIDTLAGGPADDRRAAPAVFTGGDLERGLGGVANPQEPGVDEQKAGYTYGEKVGI